MNPGIAQSSPKLGESLADVLLEKLRKSIVSGEIQPGERIHVKTLQDKYEVSHIPIREALRQLEAEGLVVNIPRRGAVASEVSIDSLQELYDMRRLIEPEIAARATKVMTDEQVELIQADLVRLDEIGESSPDSDEFIAADQQFHWHVLELGATTLIAGTIGQLWMMSERYVRIGMRGPGTPGRTRAQHHVLVDAIERRDAEQVRAALTTHLTLTEEAIRDIN